MITTAQQDYINDHAYVPEHLTHYVTTISRAEPFLFEDFLAYANNHRLIFVGYPLEGAFDEGQVRRNLTKAIHRFKPRNVALTGPAIPSSLENFDQTLSDHYYRLDLSCISISQKSRNMLKRAGRELSVERNSEFNLEHKKMIDGFLKTHPVDEATGFIFDRIDKYLSSSPNVRLFDARNKMNELIGFDVAEFTPRDYVFYMFNFGSDARYVPGASDLLLSEVIEQAKTAGKRFINLGLGINPGVTFFKKKWGGVVFLPYAFCRYEPSSIGGMDSLLRKL
jgi:hypothetical protein